MTFALYARTSTEDHQSPVDSLAWQRARAEALIAGHGTIVATFHDIGQSRSLPWSRRPEATRLLAELRNPRRGWDHVVIAEPARAFAGNEVGMVLPQLTHYGVTLWVPEVGGRVDPDSEAHDLMMMLFGGLSKAERNRLRTRVRAAMNQQATTGRWLGGRPPYGYRLADAGPHPNPEKARAGLRLHELEPNPDTAPTVARIFAMHAAGHGYKAIASKLTAEGIPSPSAADPERNTHRPGHAWASSAVRAILANPTYAGRREFGRTRKTEELIDPTQPQLGYRTRQVAHSDPHSGAVAPLVDAAAFDAVRQPPRRTGERRPRATPGRYVFAGMIRCAHCGRSMEGHSNGKYPSYRCRRTTNDYATAGPDHPANVYVSERKLANAIDRWTAADLTPERLDRWAAAIGNDVPAPDPALARARRTSAEATKRLDRLVAAIEAGMDPMLATKRARALQADIDEAEQTIAALRRVEPAHATASEMRAQVAELAALLRDTTPELRHEFFRAAGTQLEYERTDTAERLRVAIPSGKLWGLSRVGEGTRTPAPHFLLDVVLDLRAA